MIDLVFLDDKKGNSNKLWLDLDAFPDVTQDWKTQEYRYKGYKVSDLLTHFERQVIGVVHMVMQDNGYSLELDMLKKISYRCIVESWYSKNLREYEELIYESGLYLKDVKCIVKYALMKLKNLIKCKEEFESIYINEFNHVLSDIEVVLTDYREGKLSHVSVGKSYLKNPTVLFQLIKFTYENTTPVDFIMASKLVTFKKKFV